MSENNNFESEMDYALFYAKKGWKVFPVVAGQKTPVAALCPNGVKNATDDPYIVKSWWSQVPNASIGVATGEPSNIVALDIDPRNFGDRWLYGCLDEENLTEISTLTSQTGGGGLHYFFNYAGQANCSLHEGAEILSTGKQAILPPSLHASGKKYFWVDEDEEIAVSKMPVWLSSIVRFGKSKTSVDAKTIDTLPDPPNSVQPYVTAALSRAIQNIQAALPGQQEDTLNKNSFLIGTYVGAGLIGFDRAYEQLINSGLQMKSADTAKPWKDNQIVYKVNRGLLQGAANPREDSRYEKRALSNPKSSISTRLVNKNNLPANKDLRQPQNTALPLTEYGNAERLTRLHGPNLLYCASLAATNNPLTGWVVWNKVHWEPDTRLHIQELGKNTIMQISQEQPVLGDPKLDKKTGEILEEGKNLTVAWGNKCQTESSTRHMIGLARSSLNIPVKIDVFDQKPHLFVATNGTVNLNDGTIRNSNRNDFLMQKSNVEFNSEAECPLFLDFLRDCMKGNEEDLDFLQRWVGYSLTGDNSEQKMLIHAGPGGSGKSKFLEVLLAFLGDYGQTAAAQSFINGDDGQIRNDLASLRGARVVVANETRDRQQLDEPLIKRITGMDSLTCRFLNKEYFTYVPQFKIQLATNHLPRLTTLDHSIKRRLLILPWVVQFGEIGHPKRDPKIDQKLATEHEGIFNWALEGCRKWLNDGLQISETINNATQNYFDNEDRLAPFLEECCLIGDSNLSIPCRELYDNYFKFEDSRYALGKNAFYERVRNLEKINQIRVNGERVFRGIGLSPSYLFKIQQSDLYKIIDGVD